jgi:hypothetical protein
VIPSASAGGDPPSYYVPAIRAAAAGTTRALVDDAVIRRV